MALEDRAEEALQPPPTAALSQLLRGSLVTQFIYVVATLGVADLLCDGPKSSHELAAALRVDSEALYNTCPRGEVGILKNVFPSSINPFTQFFLIMEHAGADYMGTLFVSEEAFCLEMYAVLLRHLLVLCNKCGATHDMA